MLAGCQPLAHLSRHRHVVTSPTLSFTELEREPKELILGAFDATMISRYFPEFERELPRYLSRS